MGKKTERPERTLFSPLSGKNVPWSIDVTTHDDAERDVAHLTIDDPVAGKMRYDAPVAGLELTLSEWITELRAKSKAAREAHKPRHK